MSHKVDINSETWRAVQDFLEKELRNANAALKRRGAPPIDTEFERGKVNLGERLLKLPHPTRIEPQEDQ